MTPLRKATWSPGSIAIFRQMANPEYLAATLPVLAQLHLRRQEWEAARAALAEAEALATARGWDYILPETYATQAELALAEGNPAGAQQHAEQAIAVAGGLGQAVDEGKAWRAKAQALAAAGQMPGALDAFERSLALLAGQDPYEAARTQAQWGLVLLTSGCADRGKTMIQEARAVFQQLGALQDLAAVDEPLSAEAQSTCKREEKP